MAISPEKLVGFRSMRAIHTLVRPDVFKLSIGIDSLFH